MDQDSESRALVISYLNLRKMVGGLAFLLPIVLAVGYSWCCSDPLPGSISAYYGTHMRDIFVGTLCVIALFLFAYRGYDGKDNVYGDLGALFALGVAFFPSPDPRLFIKVIHYISAVAFLLILAYYARYLFTKGKEPLSCKKKRRNKIYRRSAVVIFASVVLIIIYKGVGWVAKPEGGAGEGNWIWAAIEAIERIKPVFVLETVALWAFGIAWLIKGEAIEFLNDGDEGEDANEKSSQTAENPDVEEEEKE